MSLRARGDHGSPFLHPWRPKRPGSRPARRADDRSRHEPEEPPSDGTSESPPAIDVGERPAPRRQGRGAVVSVLVLAAAVAGYASARRAPATNRLPPTPRAWFDAYLAAAVDDPSRVCQELFAPELAAEYRQSSRHSCRGFFSDVQDTPVRIARIVQADGSAVIELRQAHAPRYAWNVALGRHDGGWQAVALVSGR